MFYQGGYQFNFPGAEPEPLQDVRCHQHPFLTVSQEAHSSIGFDGAHFGFGHIMQEGGKFQKQAAVTAVADLLRKIGG